MSDAQVLEIAVSALRIAAQLSGPILLVSLVIGVVVSLVQTVTQIQEQTLSFVPKLVGVAAVILFLGSWMIRELTSWVTQLWRAIPGMF